MTPEEPLPSHHQSLTEGYIEYSPNHEERKATSLFLKSRRELIAQRYGCFIGEGCDHDHPLEAHHWFVEDSKKTGVDWIKFGKRAQYYVNPQNGTVIGDAFDWAEVAKNPGLFTDSKANLVLICKAHHTHEGTGIHHTPLPLWQLQGIGLEGFVFLEPIVHHKEHDHDHPDQD